MKIFVRRRGVMIFCRRERLREERRQQKLLERAQREHQQQFGKPQSFTAEKSVDTLIEENSPRFATKSNAFTIESLLAAPRVPRGRRPNAKYPRVQACKSMGPYGLGIFPLFPITQPVGIRIHCNNDNDAKDEDVEFSND